MIYVILRDNYVINRIVADAMPMNTHTRTT